MLQHLLVVLDRGEEVRKAQRCARAIRLGHGSNEVALIVVVVVRETDRQDPTRAPPRKVDPLASEVVRIQESLELEVR
eukprot:4169766-Alexandrium_andersonii.AAC.1